MEKTKTIWAIIAFVAIGCLISFLFFRDMQRDRQESRKELDTLDKTVYFEGEVIAAPVYNNTTLLCVKIDTSSIDSLHFFSRHCAVKVQDGVAVLPIGLIDRNDSSDVFKTHAERVVVNKDYDSKALFINGDDTLVEELSFWRGKIDEVHLLMAWENARDTVRREQHP